MSNFNAVGKPAKTLFLLSFMWQPGVVCAADEGFQEKSKEDSFITIVKAFLSTAKDKLGENFSGYIIFFLLLLSFMLGSYMGLTGIGLSLFGFITFNTIMPPLENIIRTLLGKLGAKDMNNEVIVTFILLSVFFSLLRIVHGVLQLLIGMMWLGSLNRLLGGLASMTGMIIGIGIFIETMMKQGMVSNINLRSFPFNLITTITALLGS